MQNAQRLMELEWMKVPATSPMIGRSIQEMDVRNRTGASIVAALSGADFVPNPMPDYVFQVDDMLAVLGDHTQRERFACEMACEAADLAGINAHLDTLLASDSMSSV
jgi:K+/H+ antiporter YhaU regulatory subunit KhtT